MESAKRHDMDAPCYDNLQAALNSAQPGDIIVLDAGAVFTGNFTLPAKNNPNQQWIYIESWRLNSLPVGQRVIPASGVYMSKIVTPNATAAFTIANGGVVR